MGKKRWSGIPYGIHACYILLYISYLFCLKTWKDVANMKDIYAIISPTSNIFIAEPARDYMAARASE
jgi:hypothetical protein